MMQIIRKNPAAAELANQIEWFRQLLKIVRSGDIQLSAMTVEAAVKLLERKLDELIVK